MYSRGVSDVRDDQGYGRRVPLYFTTGFEPLARATPHLTGKNTFGDTVFFGAALPTVPLRIEVGKTNSTKAQYHKNFREVCSRE